MKKRIALALLRLAMATFGYAECLPLVPEAPPDYPYQGWNYEWGTRAYGCSENLMGEPIDDPSELVICTAAANAKCLPAKLKEQLAADGLNWLCIPQWNITQKGIEQCY